MVKRPLHQTSLCEALNRVLDTGVVVMGELVISVAGVDLLYLNLNLLLTSVETLLEAQDRPAPLAPGLLSGPEARGAAPESEGPPAATAVSSLALSTRAPGEMPCGVTIP